MISTLLQKGGVDPIEVIVPSASQPIVSSSRPGNDRATKSQSLTHDVTLESELAPCPFCGKMLSLDDKRHALTECTRPYVYNIRFAYIGVHTTYIRTFVHEKMTMYEIFWLNSIVAHGLLDFTE